jgi:hypothetical protein
MPCITYQDIKIQAKSLALIRQVNGIIAEYQAQGYALTLRQVYYQLVSRALIENTEASYKRIGELVNTGRLAGIIDWEAIEDRTRNVRALPHWETPGEIIQSAAFVQAWAIVKAGEVTLSVRGVSFGNRQESLRRLARYNPTDVRAFVVPEPENPVDPAALAVMVMVQKGRGIYRLGYVPKDQTRIAAALRGRVSLRVLEGDIRGARITIRA